MNENIKELEKRVKSLEKKQIEMLEMILQNAQSINTQAILFSTKND